MPTIQIEESLHDALKETDLLSFQHKLAIEKQLTKIEHFDHVKDAELVSYGLSEPAVRRLRNALDRRKKAKKSKLFSKPKPSKFINADCDSPTSSSTANGSNTSHSADSSATPSLISRDDIKLMEQLGQGGFATVKRGIWQRAGSLVKIDCAVKILHQMSPQAVEDLHAEISHMQKLKHQNVIQLYGIVFGEPTLLILEFCDGGSLLDRLRNTKKPVLLVTKLLSYALQIASGMAYLENRHVIHRDLALRNILLAENEEVVKICDFGMTRSLEENERFYCMSGQKKVPFGWCPPESLRFRQFSHKSDCWAFGVTLWELYSYGEEPWIGHRAADVLRVTEQGEQLKKPRKCLQEIYEIMQMTWSLTPDLRPKFSHLRNLLLDIKFMTAETRESYISDDPDCLELSIGEHVIIISEDAQKEWYGQSVTSRKFGKFPHSLVSVKSHRISDMPDPSTVGISSPSAMAALSSSTNAYRKQRNKQISKPIPGSLIHTGHGDIDKDKCWGNVDHIDEIYLKNPVIRPPPGSETRSRGVSFISSITALHEDIVTTPSTNNAKVRPISSNPIKLDFDPLKAWDLPTPPTEVSLSSFPSKMPIPSRPPPPIINTKPRTTSETAKVASPFEVDWNQTPKPIPSASSKLLYEGTSAPISTQNGDSTNMSIINHRRNQTQPIVLPSVNTVETSENDPFFVDPNLKNLSIKPKPIEWRQTTTINDYPRPQSARITDNFNFAPKVEPLDQSILALLDPLMSNNSKVPPQQIAPTKPVAVSTAAVPRPQSNFNTAPSALNVLAYVSSSNKPNGQPKLSTQQAPLPQSVNAWTYLPPTTSISATIPAKVTTQSTSNKFVLPGTSPSTSKPAQIITTTKSPYVPISSLLPAPSELAVSTSSNSTNSAGSLLPPPSELLLSGLKTTNSKGADSAYGSLTSNSSVSRLTLNTGDPFNVAPQQTQQLFNIQHSPINAYNMHQKNMIITQNNQQMFLDSTGIPFLLPTPMEPKSSQPQKVSNKPQTIISLNDLDIDSMILNVKKKVDFATQEQCSKALRSSDYDVNKAIQCLKVDKLIEMGLCTDRSVAERTLSSTDWNVNEAALKLVS